MSVFDNFFPCPAPFFSADIWHLVNGFQPSFGMSRSSFSTKLKSHQTFNSKYSQSAQGSWSRILGRLFTALNSLSVSDSTFVATLYTSDAERIMRYTDEGETTELCKWTVDLSSLPSFRNNAAMQPGGFYTGEALLIGINQPKLKSYSLCFV